MDKKKKYILVVDDDVFLAKIYKTKLSKEGFELSLAHDGEEALVQIKQKRPDLILLDLMMPKKDGFEVMEELAKDPECKKIPIIILSNLGQESDVERGLALGAKDYFVKANVSLNDIVKKITKHIK
ncbi:response regulator [Patescibacteria group bacterium]|nr:response regulator [Patescibacteria group bacterium]MBU1922366.1 response regulator [Patescibacteria group bacterium]